MQYLKRPSCDNKDCFTDQFFMKFKKFILIDRELSLLN